MNDGLESLGLICDSEALRILDQQLLPHKEEWIEINNPEEHKTNNNNNINNKNNKNYDDNNNKQRAVLIFVTIVD